MNWLLLVAAAAILAGGLAQSVTGMGFSLVAAPALMAALGPRNGVATVVVLAALASLIPLARQWRAIRLLDAGSLLLPTLLATPVFALALAGANTSLVAMAAGVAVIVGVVLLARGASWAWFTGLPGRIVAGVSSALLNVVGGVGGPPVGMFAANAGWSPEQARATLQFFFLVQNVVTALIIGVVAPPWWMVVALLAGTGVGLVVAKGVSAATARIAVLVVAALGGLSLVVGNL